MKINESHFFFGSDKHQLYAMFYEPEKKSNLSEAYIILHPFAEEKKSSQIVLVDLAREISTEGNHVMLFDFFGCGDSEGDLPDANISIWLNDLRNAVELLKQKFHAKQVNLIGLRLGAYIGALYAKEHNDVSKLVLIEPVINPAKDLNRSLRGKLMKELCTDGKVSSKRTDLLSQLENNVSIDFSGHEISSFFYKDLLKYSELTFEEILNVSQTKTLLINVSQMDKPSRAFQNLILKLEDEPLIHHIVVKLEPFWGQIDLPDYADLISVIMNWCSRAEQLQNEVLNS